MPIHFQKKYSEELFVVVWEIKETLDYLLEICKLSEAELIELKNIEAEHLRIQFLIKHLLFQLICKQAHILNPELDKDAHGKPFVKNHKVYISISHTPTFIALAMHKSQAIGIDLERPREQLLRIMPRISRPEELHYINGNLETATIQWSIKEALYKLYGKRKVDFKTNLLISKIGGNYLGAIHMPDQQSEHKILIEKIKDTYLILAL